MLKLKNGPIGILCSATHNTPDRGGQFLFLIYCKGLDSIIVEPAYRWKCWYQLSTTTMVSKFQYHSHVEIWWVSENLCIPELLFGSISFYTILIREWFITILKLGWFYPAEKVLAWYIDLNGIDNKNVLNFSYPTGIKKRCNPYYRDQIPEWYYKKGDTSPTLVSTFRVGSPGIESPICTYR